MPLVLEGIVTTLSPSGEPHIAPMGPHVGAGWDSFVFRPFRTATTYRNLVATREGVFHVTDDVLLMAKAAVGATDLEPDLRSAEVVRGVVLADACRFYEFRIESVDDADDRATMNARVVHSGRLRDFFGFNRAKHAVVEAAILATRLDFLPAEEVEQEFRRLRALVDKTGGSQEHEAFAFLEWFVAGRRGVTPGRSAAP